MMWPFSRKPGPINPGPINEDWRVGDLAQSLYENYWRRDDGTLPVDAPEKGDVLKISAVYPARSKWGDGWWLIFAKIPGEAFNAREFRKVPPLNTEASAEFTAKIKALGHRKVPAK